MPELPEVETVRNILKESIKGKEILSFNFIYDKVLKNKDLEEFLDLVKGQKIVDIERRGKYLIFRLEKGYMVSHLRMEGKYYFIADESDYEKVEKKQHILFSVLFTDKSNLYYHDVRKFGTLEYIENLAELDEYFTKIGPEPWDANIDYLFNKIKKSRRKIKNILLDQSVISGLGNIYVDEVLLHSKVNPFTLGEDVTLNQAKDILDNASKILKRAIELKGTTIRSYTSSLGVKGQYQNERVAYDLQGEPCFRCKNIIIKTKISGRGTYYCNKCQVI